MSDLPPSYEPATGSPVVAQPNFNGVAASAPPQPSVPPPGQICATQCTTAIAIPPTTLPKNLQHLPYPRTAYYPTNTPTPQANAILRRRSNKSNRKCIWIKIAIKTFAVCLTVVLVVIKASRRVKLNFQGPDLPKIHWDQEKLTGFIRTTE